MVVVNPESDTGRAFKTRHLVTHESPCILRPDPSAHYQELNHCPDSHSPENPEVIEKYRGFNNSYNSSGSYAKKKSAPELREAD